MMSMAGKSMRIIVFLRMNFRLSGKFGWLVVKALVNSEYVSMIRVVRRAALPHNLSLGSSHMGGVNGEFSAISDLGVLCFVVCRFRFVSRALGGL